MRLLLGSVWPEFAGHSATLFGFPGYEKRTMLNSMVLKPIEAA